MRYSSIDLSGGVKLLYDKKKKKCVKEGDVITKEMAKYIKKLYHMGFKIAIVGR